MLFSNRFFDSLPTIYCQYGCSGSICYVWSYAWYVFKWWTWLFVDVRDWVTGITHTCYVVFLSCSLLQKKSCRAGSPYLQFSPCTFMLFPFVGFFHHVLESSFSPSFFITRSFWVDVIWKSISESYFLRPLFFQISTSAKLVFFFSPPSFLFFVLHIFSQWFFKYRIVIFVWLLLIFFFAVIRLGEHS